MRNIYSVSIHGSRGSNIYPRRIILLLLIYTVCILCGRVCETTPTSPPSQVRNQNQNHQDNANRNSYTHQRRDDNVKENRKHALTEDSEKEEESIDSIQGGKTMDDPDIKYGSLSPQDENIILEDSQLYMRSFKTLDRHHDIWNMRALINNSCKTRSCKKHQVTRSPIQESNSDFEIEGNCIDISDLVSYTFECYASVSRLQSDYGGTTPVLIMDMHTFTGFGLNISYPIDDPRLRAEFGDSTRQFRFDLSQSDFDLLDDAVINITFRVSVCDLEEKEVLSRNCFQLSLQYSASILTTPTNIQTQNVCMPIESNCCENETVCGEVNCCLEETELCIGDMYEGACCAKEATCVTNGIETCCQGTETNRCCQFNDNEGQCYSNNTQHCCDQGETGYLCSIDQECSLDGCCDTERFCQNGDDKICCLVGSVCHDEACLLTNCNSSTVGDQCLVENNGPGICMLDNTCCRDGDVCCGDDGQNCKCCGENQGCVGSECCDSDFICPREVDEDDVCCENECCGDICCGENQGCVGSECCDNSLICYNEGETNDICCETECLDEICLLETCTESTIGQQCFVEDNNPGICMSDNTCCGDGDVCCGDDGQNCKCCGGTDLHCVIDGNVVQCCENQDDYLCGDQCIPDSCQEDDDIPCCKDGIFECHKRDIHHCLIEGFQPVCCAENEIACCGGEIDGCIDQQDPNVNGVTCENGENVCCPQGSVACCSGEIDGCVDPEHTSVNAATCENGENLCCPQDQVACCDGEINGCVDQHDLYVAICENGENLCCFTDQIACCNEVYGCVDQQNSNVVACENGENLCCFTDQIACCEKSKCCSSLDYDCLAGCSSREIL